MINTWNGLQGQQLVKNILELLISSKKIPHALLFNGIEGSGKDLCAMRFAQALVAASSVPDKENIIHHISNFSEPYFKYIVPLPRGKNETDENGPLDKLSTDEIQLLRDEINKKSQNPYHRINIPKANQIKINSIRDIKKFVSLSYEEIQYRVIVISEAHLMNEASQNALLKNLEEPPQGIIFILTTPYPSLLRETIRSRCWSINFQPLSDDEVKTILTDNFEIEPETAAMIAPFAMGSVSNALKLYEHEFEEILEKTILILRYSFGRKYHSALNEILPLASAGADSIRLVIQMIIIWLNDIQKFKCGTGKYFFSKYIDTLEKFNLRFPGLQVTDTVNSLDRLSSVISNNVNLNLIALNIVFELSSLTGTYKK